MKTLILPKINFEKITRLMKFSSQLQKRYIEINYLGFYEK